MIPELSPLPTVVLVGLGNIGSQTIDALGRIKSLKRVVLVDPDFYSVSNLDSQRISRRDVNQAKARVQARRLGEFTKQSLAFGELLEENAPVYIPQEVIGQANALTERARDKETGGILMGHLVQDAGIPDIGVVVTAKSPRAMHRGNPPS